MGFYHIINAYEESGHLVLDAPFKANPVSYDVFMVKNLASKPDELREYMVQNGPASGTTKRWVLPLSVATSFSSPDPRLIQTGWKAEWEQCKGLPCRPSHYLPTAGNAGSNFSVPVPQGAGVCGSEPRFVGREIPLCLWSRIPHRIPVWEHPQAGRGAEGVCGSVGGPCLQSHGTPVCAKTGGH